MPPATGYERKILHYGPGPTTFIQDVSDRATGAWFELLRQGGCGQGELKLQDIFDLRDEIHLGDWIAFEYRRSGATYAAGGIGDRWYLGRIETIQSDSPAGASLQLFGMAAQLAEVFPGGYGGENDNVPHLYARSDIFPKDPDRALHTWDHISQPAQLVQSIFARYIATATDIITTSVIEEATPRTGLSSFTFRGEESVQSILRSLAQSCKGASWGVDELGQLYFRQKIGTVQETFQEGLDLVRLEQSRDKSLMFNRLCLTGGYVYGLDIQSGIPELWGGFYRYRANFHLASSVALYGERRARIQLPWIRSSSDANQFAREFFRDYGHPTDRYQVTTDSRTTLIKPWLGQVSLKDQSGTLIATKIFDRIKVVFNHAPFFEIDIGPEDPRLLGVDESLDERYETPPFAPTLTSLSSEPTYTGTSEGSSTGSDSATSTHTNTDHSIDPPFICGMCQAVPMHWHLTVEGVTNGSCEACHGGGGGPFGASSLNGDHTLSLVIPYPEDIGVMWRTAGFSGCADNAHPWSLFCDDDDFPGHMVLRAGTGGVSGFRDVWVKSYAEWNCFGPNTMEKLPTMGDQCNDWPEELTVTAD